MMFFPTASLDCQEARDCFLRDRRRGCRTIRHQFANFSKKSLDASRGKCGEDPGRRRSILEPMDCLARDVEKISRPSLNRLIANIKSKRPLQNIELFLLQMMDMRGRPGIWAYVGYQCKVTTPRLFSRNQIGEQVAHHPI